MGANDGTGRAVEPPLQWRDPSKATVVSRRPKWPGVRPALNSQAQPMAGDLATAYVATQVIAFWKTTHKHTTPYSASGSDRNVVRAAERYRAARRTIRRSAFGRHPFPPWSERVIVRRRGTNKPADRRKQQDANAGHRVACVVNCQLDRVR